MREKILTFIEKNSRIDLNELAIILGVEGILGAVVMMMLESFAKPELREIGYLEKEGK